MLTRAASFTAIADDLRTGRVELAAYIEQVCARIDAVDPQIQALLPEPDRRERLLREAGALQTAYPDPHQRPVLYGVLVGVKDIFRVDGLPTKAGSQLPSELFDGPEAACVSRLKAHGALILGKTATTEFAFFEPGPTRNPHNVEHTPGGSSSGSAAAVAAGYCPLAFGTQTIGSIIRPAAYCGVIGYKPSYGWISTDGVIPISKSLDHVGLFAQDMRGIFQAASILGQEEFSARVQVNWMPTLGVPEGAYLNQASPAALAAFEKQLKVLQKAGIAIHRIPALNDIQAITEHNMRVMSAEMAQVHREWFARYESLYRPRTAGLIRDGQQVNPAELEAARAAQGVLRATLEGLMKANEIDAWICPAATGPAPQGLASTGSPAMSLPWTFAGLPTVAIPADQIDRLPIGIQCIGAYLKDERLLQWAAMVERALHQP